MSATLFAVTFDRADAAGLAKFWAGVLGRPVDDGATEDFAGIGVGSPDWGWMFVKVPEPKTTKNRVHVDLAVADLDVETARLIEFGATQLAERQDGGARWVTMTDPEGNEFDVLPLQV